MLSSLVGVNICLENKQQVLKGFEDNSCASDASAAVTVKCVFAFTFVYSADDASQNVGQIVFKVNKGIENLL